MATLSFQQTSTTGAGVVNTACSSGTNSNTGGTSGSRTCTVDGTAGGVGNFAAGAGVTDARIISLVMTPGVTDWASGTYTVRLNVTTGNMNVTLTKIWICRLNSSNVNQATIASDTAVNDVLTSTGVRTFNFSGAAQSSAADTDKIFILFVFSNSASMSSSSFSVTFDQIIDTPIEESAAQNLDVPHLASGLQFFAPTIENQTSQELDTGHIASTVQLFAPTVAEGDLQVNTSHIASTEQLFAATIENQANQELATGHIASTEQLFTPTLENVDGTQNLDVPHFANVNQLFPLTTENQPNDDLNTSHLASAEQVFAATVENQANDELNTGHIASTAQLFLPTFTDEQSLDVPHLASTLTFFAPTVENQAADELNTSHIASSVVIFAPVAENQPNQDLDILFSIPPTTALFTPTVNNEGEDLFEPILAGNGTLADQILNGLISQGFLTGTLADRERARLLAKLTLTEPQNLSIQDLYDLANEDHRIAGLEEPVFA